MSHFTKDPADRSAHPGNQCLDHPEFALRNAAALCPDLSDKERNAIVSHMFPLAVHLPRSRVAVAVNLADKLCALPSEKIRACLAFRQILNRL